MAKNVSDQLVERLAAWGVRRIYGYPGDGINGTMGALPGGPRRTSISSRLATRRRRASR